MEPAVSLCAALLATLRSSVMLNASNNMNLMKILAFNIQVIFNQNIFLSLK